MLDQPEAKTIALAQQGNSAAISELYEQHRLGVYRYLYYRVNNAHAAEDLTSEVFIRMIDSLTRYRQQEVSFRAWLFQIARNLSIDYYRQMSLRNDAPLEEDMVAVNMDPGLAVDQHLTSQSLRSALVQLPDEQREVVVLRFVAGMPISEVAQLLRKSEDAVKGLQRRGLMSLRDVLSQQEVHYA